MIVCREKLSPYWVAQWTDKRGKRCRRSTKVPIEGDKFGAETLSKTQAKKRALLVADALARAEEEEYHSHDNTSVRALFEKMLAGALGRVSLRTYNNARTVYRQFCEWLGTRADMPLRLITKADVQEYVLYKRGEVRYQTVRKGMTLIRSAFEWAVDSEIIDRNPCARVRIAPDTRDEKIMKEAFTPEEVQYMVRTFPPEWASAIRCCIGVFGQRKMDILSLRWEQFDWEERVVRLVTGKVARVMKLPMVDWFYEWARARYKEALALGGEAAVYVHPNLRLNSRASQEFVELVRLHGIGVQGSKLGGKRKVWHSKTFHMLRSTCATMLHAAGVSEGMAMQLVGHASRSIHEAYLRPSDAQMRTAAAMMSMTFEEGN